MIWLVTYLLITGICTSSLYTGGDRYDVGEGRYWQEEIVIESKKLFDSREEAIDFKDSLIAHEDVWSLSCNKLTYCSNPELDSIDIWMDYDIRGENEFK